MDQMKLDLIIRAEEERDLERWANEDDDYDFDCVLTKRERESFMYVRGEQAGRQEGLAEGMAVAVLGVLRHRGIEIDAAMEARISSCRDDARLRAWLARAMVVSRADELFEPE